MTAIQNYKESKKPRFQQSTGSYLFDLAFGAAPGTILLPVVLFGILFPSRILALPGLLGIIGLWWTILTSYDEKSTVIKVLQGLFLIFGIFSAAYIATAWAGLARITLLMAICIAIKRLYLLVRYT